MSRKLAPALALGLAALTLTAPAALAQSCEDLWYRRNSIFKEAGYCFKTARAIRAFGNAGCSYDDERDVPLSQAQRGEVGAIRAEERGRGCPR